MQSAPTAIDSGETWLDATVSTTNAMMMLANQMTSAALSLWSIPAALPKPAGRPAAVAPQAAPPLRSWFAEPGSTPARVSEPERQTSWYRAPYRSPFDPMFWMSPGHPVDHMQDWIAALPFASSMISAALPQPSALMAQPRMAPLPFAMPGLPFAKQAAGGTLSPVEMWFAACEAMMRATVSAMPSTAREGGYSQPNVIDFGAAYSAYRTAGGHAAAQVVRNGSETSSRQADRTLETVAWTAAFDPFRMFQR